MDKERKGSSAHVKIVEQPQQDVTFIDKFSEKTQDYVRGVKSNSTYESFPSLKIMNYCGHATVIVSCVTKDEPYRPHPFELVGTNQCTNGVCIIRVEPSVRMEVTLQKLSVRRVKRSGIREALKLRKKVKVDPYRTGYQFIQDPEDMKALRLCIHVCTHGPNYENQVLLPPVVTNIVRDKKSSFDLSIIRLCPLQAAVDGGHKAILLCDTVAKHDIQIRFFEKKGNDIIWESYGYFEPSKIHEQVAIVFFTPAYWDQNITKPAQVMAQLRRPSDGEMGDPVSFQFLPLKDTDFYTTKRKREMTSDLSAHLSTGNLETDSRRSSEIRPLAPYRSRIITNDTNNLSDLRSSDILCSDFVNLKLSGFSDSMESHLARNSGDINNSTRGIVNNSQLYELHRLLAQLK